MLFEAGFARDVDNSFDNPHARDENPKQSAPCASITQNLGPGPSVFGSGSI